jgi:hypothetical protein
MTPPSEADQIAGLAALAGTTPSPRLDRDLVMVRLIAEAKARGVSWAQIGSVLCGTPNGKLAKRYAKNLAKSAQQKLLVTGIALAALEEGDD